ncbi:MAG TPA: DinB family protein [Rubricoccaceae bacterium]|nr:DinB family protein [Rubricoccaceae bacterium]
MTLDLDEALALLERTPAVLDAWLRGLPDAWLTPTEGPDTWSPFDIVGHLLHGERTDWLPRLRRVLDDGDTKPFEPFDRFAQFEESKGKTLPDLLDEFAAARAENLDTVRALGLTAGDFTRPGLHPALGPVTLGHLLATWVVHDLGHIAQIARVMAKRYAADVGPWSAYLPILFDRPAPAS